MDSANECLRLMAEELMRECARCGCLLTGFLLKVDGAPFFMHFGTVEERGAALAELHARLCEMVDDGRPVIEKTVRVKGDA